MAAMELCRNDTIPISADFDNEGWRSEPPICRQQSPRTVSQRNVKPGIPGIVSVLAPRRREISNEGAIRFQDYDSHVIGLNVGRERMDRTKKLGDNDGRRLGAIRGD